MNAAGGFELAQKNLRMVLAEIEAKQILRQRQKTRSGHLMTTYLNKQTLVFIMQAFDFSWASWCWVVQWTWYITPLPYYFSWASWCWVVQWTWYITPLPYDPWRLHDMQTLSALVALWEGNSPVTEGFPSQSFDVSFVIRLDKLRNKHSICCLFETPWLSLSFTVMCLL